MTSEQYKLLGVFAEVQVPSTLAKAVEIAGEEKVLAAYNDHIVYHGVAGIARNRLAPLLEKRFPNTPRETEKNEKGKDVISETPADYVNRLRTAEPDFTDEVLAQVLQMVLNSDEAAFARVAKAERAPSRAKAGKSCYEIVERAAAKPGGLPALAARLSEALKREVTVDVDDLARAVQAHRQIITAEYQAKVKAATASLLEA